MYPRASQAAYDIISNVLKLTGALPYLETTGQVSPAIANFSQLLGELELFWRQGSRIICIYIEDVNGTPADALEREVGLCAKAFIGTRRRS